MPFTKETASRYGKLGGLETRRRIESDPTYYSRIGKRGGEKLRETNGREHFSKIGSLPRPGRRKAN